MEEFYLLSFRASFLHTLFNILFICYTSIFYIDCIDCIKYTSYKGCMIQRLYHQTINID